MTSPKNPRESTPEPVGSSRTSAPASTDEDTRTPEERLLARRKLGTAYLEDVRSLIARAEAAEHDLAIERSLIESYKLATEQLKSRIAELEAEVERLRRQSLTATVASVEVRPRRFGTVFTRRHDDRDG